MEGAFNMELRWGFVAQVKWAAFDPHIARADRFELENIFQVGPWNKAILAYPWAVNDAVECVANWRLL